MSLFCLAFLFGMNTATLVWHNSVPLPHPLQSGVCGSNRNHSLIYIIGGYKYTESDQNPNEPSSYIYRFNGKHFSIIGTTTLAKDLQSTKLNTEFTYYTSINDLIYMIGPHNTLWSYNTNSLLFNYNVSALNPHIETSFTCMTSNNTHLFIFIVSNAYKMSLWTYHIKYKSWHLSNPSIWSGPLASCIYYNHNVYLFGHFQSNPPFNDDPNQYRHIMTYNDVSSRWNILVQQLFYSTKLPQLVMPNNNGFIYILGGRGPDPNGNSMSTVTLFNANKKTFQTQHDLLQPTWSFMNGFIDGYIYIIGGIIIGPKDTSISSSEVSNIIPTLHPTKTPTKPTHSPSNLPTYSPSMSPTQLPTEHVLIHFELTVIELILIICAIFVFVLITAIAIRKWCWCKHKTMEYEGWSLQIRF